MTNAVNKVIHKRLRIIGGCCLIGNNEGDILEGLPFAQLMIGLCVVRKSAPSSQSTVRVQTIVTHAAWNVVVPMVIRQPCQQHLRHGQLPMWPSHRRTEYGASVTPGQQ